MTNAIMGETFFNINNNIEPYRRE